MRRAVLAVVLAGASTAFACGYCVEDKMAAVYDHAVVTRALERKHQVAFFHVEGALAPGEAARRSIEKIAGSSAGVDAGSARVSVSSASLAVAFDARRTSVATLQKDIERRLAASRLSLLLLQVIDRPADFGPSASRALRAAGR